MHDACCVECGASWLDGLTCDDHFHQMLAWETEYSALWEVHHLTVLCYHLQHPSLYSPAGLASARKLLADFVLGGATPAQVRRHSRSALDSGLRQFKLTGSPEKHAAYPERPPWTVTSPDITAGGPGQYIELVRSWAKSVERAIRMNEG